MRPRCLRGLISSWKFQSTHPGWGATAALGTLLWVAQISIHAPRVGCDNTADAPLYAAIRFQSTHPGWGATCAPRCLGRVRCISIHAPRVGCDAIRADRLYGQKKISIHAPRVGCDLSSLIGGIVSIGSFQSTHPGWGATYIALMRSAKRAYFNPRTPGGVRHACWVSIRLQVKFQSTHPGWGATQDTG